MTGERKYNIKSREKTINMFETPEGLRILSILKQ